MRCFIILLLIVYAPPSYSIFNTYNKIINFIANAEELSEIIESTGKILSQGEVTLETLDSFINSIQNNDALNQLESIMRDQQAHLKEGIEITEKMKENAEEFYVLRASLKDKRPVHWDDIDELYNVAIQGRKYVVDLNNRVQEFQKKRLKSIQNITIDNPQTVHDFLKNILLYSEMNSVMLNDILTHSVLMFKSMQSNTMLAKAEKILDEKRKEEEKPKETFWERFVREGEEAHDREVLINRLKCKEGKLKKDHCDRFFNPGAPNYRETYEEIDRG